MTANVFDPYIDQVRTQIARGERHNIKMRRELPGRTNGSLYHDDRVQRPIGLPNNTLTWFELYVTGRLKTTNALVCIQRIAAAFSVVNGVPTALVNTTHLTSVRIFPASSAPPTDPNTHYTITHGVTASAPHNGVIVLPTIALGAAPDPDIRYTDDTIIVWCADFNVLHVAPAFGEIEQ